MLDGFLSEVSTKENSWAFDAAWVKASDPRADIYSVISGALAARARVDLAWVSHLDLTSALFYGLDSEKNGKFYGLSDYYGTCDTKVAQNAVNVIDANGKSDSRASVWLVAWGPRTVYMASETGQPEMFGWCGLVIKDWRYCFRIANIDPGISQSDLHTLMQAAYCRLPTTPGLRPTFYMSESLHGVSGDQFGVLARPMKELRDDENKVV